MFELYAVLFVNYTSVKLEKRKEHKAASLTVHFFMQQIFAERLVYTWCWDRAMSKTDTNPYLHSTYIVQNFR